MDDNDTQTASPARKIHRSRTVSCTELTEEQLRNIVAKILQVSWSEDSAGLSYLLLYDIHDKYLEIFSDFFLLEQNYYFRGYERTNI